MIKQRIVCNMEIKETSKIRVRFNEVDSLGIVWHGNYITYFEDGREHFGNKHGISYLDVKAKGLATPIVESVCKHKLPLKYGDIATIETTFVDTLANKLIFTYKIYNPDGEIVCTGKTVQVFIDEKGELVLNTPLFIKEWKIKVGLLAH
ncbi:MAG: acyl-CoA thioesterase [Flavobacteriaceae bacterium]|nr:acyl-CoA thioesterase [Flavobacteriaceae bacterium]